MKRSEMVEIIINTLSELESLKLSKKQKANKLLDAVQVAGMLPPSEILRYKTLNGTKGGTAFMCVWEEEDDKVQD